MPELLGFGVYVTILVLIKIIQNFRCEASLKRKFEWAQEIKQDLILLISWAKACKLISLDEAIEELAELKFDLEESRLDILAVDDEGIFIIGQLNEFFDKARREFYAISRHIEEEKNVA